MKLFVLHEFDSAVLGIYETVEQANDALIAQGLHPLSFKDGGTASTDGKRNFIYGFWMTIGDPLDGYPK